MDWLRGKRENGRFDPAYLLVCVIALLAIMPLLSRSALPTGTDAELHIYRLAELSRMIRGGDIYPRWAANFYFGYGYPIFNYYAPLIYYLALPLELLTNDAVLATKAVMVFGILLSGISMYGFVRDNWGRSAGLVAAACYLYAPYLHYVDPHARGALAESFSFAVFPFALWGLDRLRQRGGRINWLWAVVGIAAIVLTHNLMALTVVGLLTGWLVWHTYSVRNGWLWVALALGIGLSAFFWLPVGLEQNAVNLDTLIGEGDNFDFRTHFVNFNTLLSPSEWIDWGATEPLFIFNLGVPQWALALIGIVFLLQGKVKRRRHVAFFAVSAVILIFMMTRPSLILWETIPLLPFMQFPWRLLGVTVGVLSILAGIGVDALLDMVGRKGWITAVFVLLPLLFALPLTQLPNWNADFGDTDMRTIAVLESQGRWLGTTSTADFVPATVDSRPDPNADMLLELFENRPFIDRVNYASLKAENVVTQEPITPTKTRYFTDSPKPFALRLFLLDFPGWDVRVDGEKVATELGRPEGFIVVPLPAGQHTVDVAFRNTPARNLAWGITALSLLLALGLCFRVPQWEVERGKWGVDLLPSWVAVVGLIGLFLVALNPSGVLRWESADYHIEPAEVNLFASFDEKIGLVGFDGQRTQFSAGDTLHLTLYWQALQDLDETAQVFVHILQEDGAIAEYAQSDKLNPGDFPTKLWPTDKYVRDDHSIWLPDTLPAGKYQVTTGLWFSDTGQRLPITDDAGQLLGDVFHLFEFEVIP